MTGDIPLPPAPYVPGRTPRHPEDWFDQLKADAARLERSTAFRAGLVYFDAGYFWECHEVLEAVWMAAPDPSAERDFVQAIIQLANARLKARMERPRAVLRLCDIVDGLLSGLPDRIMGQDVPDWRAATARTRAAAV